MALRRTIFNFLTRAKKIWQKGPKMYSCIYRQKLHKSIVKKIRESFLYVKSENLIYKQN
jgi:hypothetical protein